MKNVKLEWIRKEAGRRMDGHPAWNHTSYRDDRAKAQVRVVVLKEMLEESISGERTDREQKDLLVEVTLLNAELLCAVVNAGGDMSTIASLADARRYAEQEKAEKRKKKR